MATTLSISAPDSPSAPTFEQPFEMLHACHDRVRRMLALLDRLVAHIPANGVDRQAREAARDVLRYFDEAAPQHHLDEELHVFPRLESGAPAGVRELVARLRADHEVMKAGDGAQARSSLGSRCDPSAG